MLKVRIKGIKLATESAIRLMKPNITKGWKLPRIKVAGADR